MHSELSLECHNQVTTRCLPTLVSLLWLLLQAWMLLIVPGKLTMWLSPACLCPFQSGTYISTPVVLSDHILSWVFQFLTQEFLNIEVCELHELSCCLWILGLWGQILHLRGASRGHSYAANPESGFWEARLEAIMCLCGFSEPPQCFVPATCHTS